MKTLAESIFDDKLIEKDLFDNPGFKKWINQPNTLWYLYFYWESEWEDPFENFMAKEWEMYKPLVDALLDILNNDIKKVFGPKGWSCFQINYDQWDYNDGIADLFADQDDFDSSLGDVLYEIQHKSVREEDGIWMTWFKGGIPKNSAANYFLERFDYSLTKPGKLDGGIMLTNQDTFILIGFPKGMNKDLLKLFNIR